MIVVPFGGVVLALEDEDFEKALERGRELLPSGSTAGNNSAVQIVDAAGAEAATGVPASWWLEAARRGDVPHLRLGKYVRFNLSEALDSLSQCRGRHGDKSK